MLLIVLRPISKSRAYVHQVLNILSDATLLCVIDALRLIMIGEEKAIHNSGVLLYSQYTEYISTMMIVSCTYCICRNILLQKVTFSFPVV